MKDLYFSGEQEKLNDILKGCIEVLKHPLVIVSYVENMRYKVASRNGCFVVFVNGVALGNNGNIVEKASSLDFGNTKVRTKYADNKLTQKLSSMVIEKCTDNNNLQRW